MCIEQIVQKELEYTTEVRLHEITLRPAGNYYNVMPQILEMLKSHTFSSWMEGSL